MEVSDSAMSEESTSTASSSNVPCDDKSVCQVCFVKGNEIFAISNVPISLKIVKLIFLVNLIIFKQFFKAPECEKRYVHYGAICCYGCRAFFRRAHQTSRSPKFVCKSLKMGNTARIGMCSIDTKCTKQCKYCRHQRCLKAGPCKYIILI